MTIGVIFCFPNCLSERASLHSVRLILGADRYVFFRANADTFTFTFCNFADAFIQSDLQLGNT